MAKAGGSPTLVYQWKRNGTNINNGGNISGAQTDSLTISNVSAGDAGSYSLLVTNTANFANSDPATLAVVPAPAPGNNYAYAIFTNNPITFWRLNETGDPSTNPPAYDYIGGRIGTYEIASQNGFNNTIVGPRPSAFPGFESTNTAVQTTVNGLTASWVTLPAINLNTDTVTFTAWIYPNAPHGDYNGLLMTRNGSTPAAGLHFTLDNQIGYTWNGGDQDTYTFASELRPPEFQWSFVALVINPTNAALYLYNTNNLSSTNNAIPHTSEAWDGNAQLGGDQELAGWRIFDGTIDEVAVFNYAFTPPQILNLYNSAFTAAPPSVTLTIQKNGSNLILSWPQGTLQSAPNVTGTYTNVPSATSPYTNSPTGSQKFYRVHVQ